MRTYKINRDTLETKISVEINLDGSGKSEIDTGIGFFDHMLNSFARHGLNGVSRQIRYKYKMRRRYLCR